MKRNDSINYLKKLYVLLDNLMGSTLLGTKYVRSLKKGIKSLERNKLLVDNGSLKVEVDNNKGSITVDVSYINGKLIESHTYSADSIISDKIIGKS